MADTVYIVITQQKTDPQWKAEGVFAERRLADNYIELDKLSYSSFKYAIVEGTPEPVL